MLQREAASSIPTSSGRTMRILAVDDDATSRLVLHAMVTALGHECLLASDAREAWQILEREAVDVVITDRVMPWVDGLEFCRRIRDEHRLNYIYVVLLTVMGEVGQELEGMLAGADDYLTKPVSHDQLRSRLIAADRVSALHRQLEQQKMELQAGVRRDPLTRLSNRVCLQEDMKVLSGRVARYGHQYSLVLLDLDQFKLYNDLYGREAGDQALKTVAGVITGGTRSGDMAYRFGGQAFLIVLAEQSPSGALIAAQHLLAAVADAAIQHSGSNHGGVLTVTAGIAQMTDSASDVDAALRRADEALHYAKARGRNTIDLADPGPSHLHREVEAPAGAVPSQQPHQPAGTPILTRLERRTRLAHVEADGPDPDGA
jgi:diguanylate cyclase (GGDEF)-like protein